MKNPIADALHSVDKQIAQLQAARSVLAGLVAPPVPGSGKRQMSAAGRRRISLAQKARWAKLRQRRRA